MRPPAAMQTTRAAVLALEPGRGAIPEPRGVVKRSPMPARKTGLKAGKGLKRGAPLRAGKRLKSTAGLSTKAVNLYGTAQNSRSEGDGISTGLLPSSITAHDRWKNAVWSKDLGVCQAGPGGRAERRVPEVRCQGGLDPHHVWPKGAYPARRYDPENGAVLCRAHHDWVHGHTNEARKRGLFV